MEQVRKRLSCAEANKMDLVDYLATIGYEPKKIRGNDYWYASPFRQERTPSFKVDRKHNIWYDHGEGKGGNFVDFGLAYHHCNVSDLLKRLSGEIAITVPTTRVPRQTAEGDHNKIIITDAKTLTNTALLQYAESRGIPAKIASQFCHEVSYQNGGKNYYAIGFKNDQGGYELRSKYFKASSAPKDITHLKSGAPSLTVFEGFFNFLSFQSLQPKDSTHPSDFLILNSLSFFERARPVMETYKEANLYLDNNTAGRKFTAYACSLSTVYKDRSSCYEGHEDLNDFLKAQKPAVVHEIQRKRLRL